MATETVTVDGVQYEIPSGLSFRQKQKYIRRLKNGEDPSRSNSAPTPEPYEIGTSDILRAAGQGVYSFGDEIEAGVRTGFGLLGDYRETKDQINKEIEQAREANPWAMYGAEIGTGFLVPGGNIARGAGLATKGATTLGQAFKQGAKQGAFDGALFGLGAADDMDDAIGSTLGGAALGAGMGGPLSAVIPGVGKLFARDDEANSIIRQAAQEAGLDADMVIAELKSLGPEATLADMSPELRSLAVAAQGLAGPSSKNLGMLAERNAAGPRRLADDVESQTGANLDSARNEKQRLIDQRDSIANEEYKPVDAATFVADDVAHLTDNPVASRYLRESIEAYAARSDNPYDMGQLQRLMNGDPEVDLPGAVPAKILQVARSLMAQDAQALRESVPPKNMKASVLEDTVRQFDEMLGQIDGYLDANTNFARTSQLIEDIDVGGRIAQNTGRYGDDKALVRSLDADPGRRQALAVGAQSDLINDLLMSGGGRQTGLATTRLGPLEQSRLRQEAAQVDLTDSINRENTFHDTFAQLTPTVNSKTSSSQQAVDRLNQDMSLLSRLGDVVSPGRAAIKTASEQIQKRFKLKNKEVASQITNRLLQQGMTPEQIVEILERPEGVRMLADMIAKTQGSLQAATRASTAGLLGE
jgi:hypothetical protein